jgi:hypothetical protein
LRCSAALEEEEKGDNIIAAVAFFTALRYNATPQEKEEGEGSFAVVAFFFLFFLATQRRTPSNKQTRKKKGCLFGSRVGPALAPASTPQLQTLQLQFQLQVRSHSTTLEL